MYETAPKIFSQISFVVFTFASHDGAMMVGPFGPQTVESVRADEPRALEGGMGRASLFVEVPSLDEAVGKLPEGTEVFVERRTTPYGATETFLRDAAGNVVILAEFK